jgi:hypothetical protein
MARIIVYGLLILGTFVTKAQTPDIRQQNIVYLDSVEGMIRRTWCDGILIFKDDHSKLLIKQAKRYIQALNEISSDDFEIGDLDKTLKRFGTKVWVESDTDGHVNIQVLGTVFQNFSVRVKLEYIENIIVGKRFSVYQQAHCTCGNSYQGQVDLPLIRRAVAEVATWPITIMDYIHEVYWRKLMYENLALLAGRDSLHKYVYNIRGEESWINKLLDEQFLNDVPLVYDQNDAPWRWPELLMAGKTDLLKKLLYSPSYYFAVNAMEALEYADSLHKVTLSSEIRDRMKEIKIASCRIKTRNFDVRYDRQGYKEIYAPRSQIYYKYDQYIKKHQL